MELPSATERSLKKAFEFCANYSKNYFNTECCALIGLKGKSQYYVQIVANRSPEPMSFFTIDPVDYLNFASQYKVLFIFHSHPHTESSFSDLDKENSEAVCVPFLMYSVQDNKFALYIPENHELDVNTLTKAKGLI
jgi:proteasome lid subunit RPN8/RPN11